MSTWQPIKAEPMKLYLLTYGRDHDGELAVDKYQLDGRHNLTTSKRIAEAIVRREENCLVPRTVTRYRLVRDNEIVYEHTYDVPRQRALDLETTSAEEYLRAKARHDFVPLTSKEREQEARDAYCKRELESRQRRELLRLLSGAEFTVNLHSSTTKAATEPVDCTTFTITINITENSND